MGKQKVLDRAIGTLIGAGVADALGAGYEGRHNFETKFKGTPEMIGGGFGNFAPYEWTDDTIRTYIIARAAAGHPDLTSQAALDQISSDLVDWLKSNPSDIGIQTANVLRYGLNSPTAKTLTTFAQIYFKENRLRSAGNGSLMGTSPVALAYLYGQDAHLIAAATQISNLTHADPLCAEACALWCLGIKQTVLTGKLPNLNKLAKQIVNWGRTEFWQQAIAKAEQEDPKVFVPNGYVLTALQAAWSAITHTPQTKDLELWFRQVMTRVIAIGHDTDTTATIAGAMAGAYVGYQNIPAEWKEKLHGYPNATAANLIDFATQIVANGG